MQQLYLSTVIAAKATCCRYLAVIDQKLPQQLSASLLLLCIDCLDAHHSILHAPINVTFSVRAATLPAQFCFMFHIKVVRMTRPGVAFTHFWLGIFYEHL